MSRILKTLTVISLSALLVACARDDGSKRQLSGNDDYLESPELKTIQPTSDMTLPMQYSDYNIPEPHSQGGLGKALDIRPPLQILGILNGSHTQMRGDQAEVMFESSGANVAGALQTALAKKQASATNSGADSWTTDWVNWDRKDEKTPYQARYQINAVGNGYSSIMQVKLIELRQNGQAVTSPNLVSRYTVLMLNTLIEQVYQEQNKNLPAVESAASQE